MEWRITNVNEIYYKEWAARESYIFTLSQTKETLKAFVAETFILSIFEGVFWNLKTVWADLKGATAYMH